ncbi:PREDICTED: uncharacterized protein LOC105562228 [Vollenhovia emeryi]|uniref:uncharacterized protein LOC105562228 n=1 Tax=Vollenhovia emeryi TaxID=411798 RepID=UPI0005F52E45|nr:PREDICTED: uncharacterized protein LOC105562228 [Vollenhovia emeryi]
MFWCCGFLSFLLLLGGTYGAVSGNRIRREAQNGQLIDDIFNIPITAIRQTASAAQILSPENTQAINNIFKIPVSTLEAVGTLVKTTREQSLRNSENNQARLERRERILAMKEQKRKRKEEIQNHRLQQQLTRPVRHYSDPLGLNALSDLLIGHHAGGLFGGHSGLSGNHGHHRGHKIGHGLHGHHGGHLGNRPQHTYEVHEDVNEDTSFSWHGVTAGIGTLSGTRPSSTSTKIENKVAPKEKRQKASKIKNEPLHEYRDPPLENKIAPRNGRVAFVS